MAQGSFPTLEEATEQGRAAVESIPDTAWSQAAESIVLSMAAGVCFLAEEIVERLERLGQPAPDRRAMGAVIQRLSRARAIERTGRHLPARTSHGSPKPEWRRCHA